MVERQPIGLLTMGDRQLSSELDDALDRLDVSVKWDELLSQINLQKQVRKFVFGGFESLDDYEKYGDLFV